MNEKESEMHKDLGELQIELFQFATRHRDNFPDSNFKFLYNQMDEALQDMLGYFEQ